MSEIAAAALAYAARDWFVFPVHSLRGGRCACPAGAACPRPGKHPLTPRGWRDASRDPAQIAAWWRRWPAANVAIATGPSGLVVLDIDPRHGGDAALTALERRYGPLPVTVTAVTGGGGSHHYFTAPPHPVIRSRVGVLPGIDVRAAGGYAIAPPSLHESGRLYTWAPGRSPDAVPLAPLPEWLLTIVADDRSDGHRAGAGADHDGRDGFAAGGRNDGLTRIGGLLRRLGLTPAAIEAALLAVNEAVCLPPLPPDEVRRLARGLGRYPPGWGVGDARRPVLVVEVSSDGHAV